MRDSRPKSAGENASRSKAARSSVPSRSCGVDSGTEQADIAPNSTRRRVSG
jgi:hypothetical protein